MGRRDALILDNFTLSCCRSRTSYSSISFPDSLDLPHIHLGLFGFATDVLWDDDGERAKRSAGVAGGVDASIMAENR